MRRRDVERPMDELVRAVPAAIADAGLRPNACILASRLGVTALRSRGVRARPLAVRLAVYNPPAAAALQDGTLLEEHALSWGGRIVQLGYGVPDGRPGWDGHLVVVVEERYVLDLTASQVRRLDDGRRPIEAEAFWLEAPELVRGRPEVMRGDDGSTWVYEPRPADKSFLSQPAWSGFRVQVRGDQVVSERQAVLAEGFVAPRVTVKLGG